MSADCDDPLQAREIIGEFVRYYNQDRLHHGIRFVAPVERHEGRDEVLLAARRSGLVEARRDRPVLNRRADLFGEHASEHQIEGSNDRNVEGSKDPPVRLFS
jgi:hypothetical protein